MSSGNVLFFFVFIMILDPLGEVTAPSAPSNAKFLSHHQRVDPVDTEQLLGGTQQQIPRVAQSQPCSVARVGIPTRIGQ